MPDILGGSGLPISSFRMKAARANRGTAMKLDFSFKAQVWLYPGKAGWHFVTLPKKLSAQIKSMTEGSRNGWGSVRVAATIGKTTWKTSLFPDSKKYVYVLPLKADVRKKESANAGASVSVLIQIDGSL